MHRENGEGGKCAAYWKKRTFHWSHRCHCCCCCSVTFSIFLSFCAHFVRSRYALVLRLMHIIIILFAEVNYNVDCNSFKNVKWLILVCVLSSIVLFPILTIKIRSFQFDSVFLIVVAVVLCALFILLRQFIALLWFGLHFPVLALGSL